MPYQSSVKKHVIKVGSRKSELALKQSSLIIDMLKECHGNLEIELITMDTIGDKILDVELSKIGDKSLFTKELELALISKEVDIVVHSLKDVPTAMCSDFVLGCICMRENNNDVVVMRRGSPYKTLEELPEGSVIGTSSVRRVAQLKRKHGSKLKFASIRGNLNTRFMKLDDPEDAKKLGKGDGQKYEALIIAHAGLERLGWEYRINQILSDDDTLYAVGQGALACECRADDHETLKLLSIIHHEPSALSSIAERSLMRALDGGCSTPISVRCTIVEDVVNDDNDDDDEADDDEADNANGEILSLKACVMSVDGEQCVVANSTIKLPITDDSCTKPDGDINGVSTAKRRRCDYSPDDFLFLGLRVWPICEIGRLRMKASRQLGCNVAAQLILQGADKILADIKRTEAEMKLMKNNSYTGLDRPQVTGTPLTSNGSSLK